MKYLLAMYLNPDVMAGLSEQDMDGIMTGHQEYIRTIRESGEMIGTQALAPVADSSVVRVRGGLPAITDGPFLETKEFLAGYYLVDVEDKARALELAAMIPDAAIDGLAVEVREIVFFADAESAIPGS
ncbi:YciI family protein [Amycolatopsis sp., V23-08]|uniref:YciI family protein n=1 Tax=Amycolatopsis heterodermiae TaxID=3110235 RepID=A0ABU5RKZ8_9PSEU|nr:YciI family protein [Amycolatopsis sp., V23-08]MEA5366971.1 YciI family protein [Amycolatopsis sp., V23-08]